jgi:PPP family 3-phenylpropionic acid transporter
VPFTLVLSVYWFAVLAALGLFFPLFSLYLSENLGLSGAQTGIVTAALPLAGLFAQPLWGAMADRSGSRLRILALVTAGAAAGYVHLWSVRGFAGVLVATLALATFSTSVMPMSISVSLALLRARGRHAFGLVRSVISSRWPASLFCSVLSVLSFPLSSLPDVRRLNLVLG